MIDTTDLLPILLGVSISVILGFMWYSPMMFGKPWMKLMGLNLEKIKKGGQNMGRTYALMMVGSLITAITVRYLLSRLGVDSVIDGAMVGLIVSGGLVATAQLNNVLFGGKSFGLYLIETGYQVASVVLMGAVMGSL